MTLPNKSRDLQHLILALRQRGMHNMDMSKDEAGQIIIRMSYYGPGTPMLQATIFGRTDIDAMENARDFLVENGLPL